MTLIKFQVLGRNGVTYMYNTETGRPATHEELQEEQPKIGETWAVKLHDNPALYTLEIEGLTEYTISFNRHPPMFKHEDVELVERLLCSEKTSEAYLKLGDDLVQHNIDRSSSINEGDLTKLALFADSLKRLADSAQSAEIAEEMAQFISLLLQQMEASNASR